MRGFVIGCALLAVAMVAACDRLEDPLSPSEVMAEHGAVLTLLEEAGYRGPALVQEWIALDRAGRPGSGRSLALPRRGLELVDRARRGEPGYAARFESALQAQEVSDPEQIDPDNNSLSSQLNGIVVPSVLNGPDPTRSKIESTNYYINYDYTNDEWYIVEAAEVKDSRVIARDESAGHHHGTEAERTLRRRVGWLEPETGSFSSSTWENTWMAPEYAQEVRFEYDLLEIGGPNDGEEATFYSLYNSATRLRGLARIPPPTDGSYVRVGGTTPHPEDFNDWVVSGFDSQIVALARDYHAATGDHVRVNDASLFFGGRFDLAANWGTGSHQEHRFGTEIDMRPSDMSLDNRAQFAKAAEAQVASLLFEEDPDHYHARHSSSYYRR